MHIVKIPKRKGVYRTIYVPNYEEKKELKKILRSLERSVEVSSVAHGFVKQRSAVTNAKAHIGYRYSLCFDFKDFFDTITPSMVSHLLPEEIMDLVFVDGAARQGLPTSPLIANLACIDFDAQIEGLKATHQVDFVYTRYADDLTFSFHELEVRDLLLHQVPQLAEAYGLQIHSRKTHFMDAKQGVRHITGVGVDETGLRPTREMKRKLRAAIHQQHTNEARGLAEWVALKEPKPYPYVRLSEEELLKRSEKFLALNELLPTSIYDYAPLKGNVTRAKKIIHILRRRRKYAMS